MSKNPPECDLRLDTNECYFFGPNQVDYITASKFCLTRGLRMAEVLTDEDQTNLQRLIRGTRVTKDQGVQCLL